MTNLEELSDVGYHVDKQCLDIDVHSFYTVLNTKFDYIHNTDTFAHFDYYAFKMQERHLSTMRQIWDIIDYKADIYHKLIYSQENLE